MLCAGRIRATRPIYRRCCISETHQSDTNLLRGKRFSLPAASKFSSSTRNTFVRKDNIIAGGNTYRPISQSTFQPKTFFGYGNISKKRGFYSFEFNNLHNIARFSSTSSATTSTISPRSRQRVNWKLVARILKITRVPVLVVAVFGLGYQQGTIDYASNPSRKEKELLRSVLADFGVKDPAVEVQTFRWGDEKWTDSFIPSFLLDNQNFSAKKRDGRLVRVSNVGQRIIQASLVKVENTLDDIVQERSKSMPDEIRSDGKKLINELNKDDEVHQWVDAHNRLNGPWEFVLINSPIPNAFVSEVFPKRIFITTGIFELFIENDDELGLVLGHEVSHLIFAHNSQRNQIELLLRAFEVLLISMDPTDGLLSVSFITMLGGLRNLLTRAHSRENEREADEMGIKVAAMACFDTKRGSEVFRKMHEFDVKSGKVDSASGSANLSDLLQTHPASKARYEFLLEASEEENMKKYEDTTCNSIQNSFRKMFLKEKEM